jgi:hypothetical protein
MAAGRKTGGRTKGTPNKINAAVKEAIIGAFNKVGGETYLVDVAKTDPRTFCTLLGKVLPTQLTGAEEGPIHVVSETAGSAVEKLRAELARLSQRHNMATPIEPPTSDIAKFKINKEVGVEAKEARKAAAVGDGFW